MPEKTKYHILVCSAPATGGDNPTPERWDVVETGVEAHSANDAIRQTAKANGIFVAVPSRSFTPTSVTIEQTTSVKLGAS